MTNQTAYDVTKLTAIASEKALLGMIIAHASAFSTVEAIVKADDFYNMAHQVIWQALCDIHARGDSIDLISATEELRQKGRLADVGGDVYLSDLACNAPSAIHQTVDTHARTIERGATRRRLYLQGRKLAELAFATSTPLEVIREAAESGVSAVFSRRQDTSLTNAASAVSRALDKFTQVVNSEHPPAFATGFRDMDRLLDGGLYVGELSVWGGMPGIGKSSWALNIIARRMAAPPDTPDDEPYPRPRIFFASLEMSEASVMRRLATIISDVPGSMIRKGTDAFGQPLTPKVISAVTKAYGEIANWPLVLDTKPMTILGLRDKLERLGQVDLVMVDYLQLIKPPANSKGNRAQEVYDITNQLKDIAKEFDTHVFALASLNRAGAMKKPTLFDFRESSIEYGVDVAAGIWRDTSETALFPNQVEMLMFKNREGPTGSVDLYIDRAHTRFVDADTRTIDLRATTATYRDLAGITAGAG